MPGATIAAPDVMPRSKRVDDPNTTSPPARCALVDGVSIFRPDRRGAHDMIVVKA
jgi:hypothetical protein